MSKKYIRLRLLRVCLTLFAITGLTMLGANAFAAGKPPGRTLTGNWGGARQKLLDDGIDLGFIYTGQGAYNVTGGDRHASAYVDEFQINGDLDFDKLFGWAGGSLHFTLLNRNGNEIDAKANLGTLLLTQEQWGGGDITRLPIFYLEQKFSSGLVTVKLGRMTFGQYYPFKCKFMNLNFCASLPAWLGQGIPGYPIGQFGLVVGFHPTPEWFVNVGAYRVNPDVGSKANALRIFPRGTNAGEVFAAEVGWHTKLNGGSGSAPLKGTWRIGGWHNNAPYPDLLLDVNGMPQVLTGAAPLMRDDSSGVFAMGQQQLTHNAAGGGLSLFGNLILGNPDVDLIDQMISVGFYYKAPFASRPHDRIGFAIGRDQVSSRVAASEAIQNANGLGPVAVQDEYEYIMELDYNAEVYRGVFLMPDLQYILHPGGTSTRPNVTQIGLQLQVYF
ncbi:MAG: carbohydrate porin [Gammaproteobacteria bacterium]